MGCELLWLRCDFVGFHYLLVREIAILFLNEVDMETSLFISSYASDFFLMRV